MRAGCAGLPNIWARPTCTSRSSLPSRSFRSKRRASFLGGLSPLWLQYCMALRAGAIRMMSMLYQAYQNHMDLTAPWRTGAAQALKYLNLVPQGVSDRLFRRLAAALELISRTSLTYTRPAYGIDKVLVGNQELEVTEEVAFATPFGSLLHFKKAECHRNSRGCCWWRRCPVISRRCCAAPCRRCCRITTSTSPTGTIPRDIPLQPRQVRPRRLHRAPDHLSRRAGTARAHGRDLSAVGVGARRRRDHVGGQSSRAPGDTDIDGRPDRHADPADQGQRIRQEQAAQMVRGQSDQLRADPVQGRVPAGLSRLRATHRVRVR